MALSLEDLKLNYFVPDEYDEVFDAMQAFVMQDSEKWKSTHRIAIRKRLAKLSETITALNDRYRKGEISQDRFEMLLKMSDLALENLQIESDLLNKQARALVVKRGKQVIAAIVQTVTGLNVDKVLGLK